MTRITDDELQKFIDRGGVARDAAGKIIREVAEAEKSRANKYGAEKQTVDDIVFDSKLEAARYHQLSMMQRAGEITDLEVHPHFPLDRLQLLRPLRFHPTRQYPEGKVPGITLDFGYRIVASDRGVLEDTKGRMTADAQLRIAIFESMYDADVVIVRKGDI